MFAPPEFSRLGRMPTNFPDAASADYEPPHLLPQIEGSFIWRGRIIELPWNVREGSQEAKISFMKTLERADKYQKHFTTNYQFEKIREKVKQLHPHSHIYTKMVRLLTLISKIFLVVYTIKLVKPIVQSAYIKL